MKREQWIDSLKGFAMITVVLGHIARGYYIDGMFLESKNMLKIMHDTIYLFHMPLFFMISGFVFAHAYLVWGGGRKSSA